MHVKIAEQRMKPSHDQNPKTAEDHYQRGIAMMNVRRWDDARESLDKARKAAPKADHVHYALAALDCLTGEADSAMANLKVAIQLNPKIAFTPVTMRTSPSFRKTRASPNCFILKRMAPSADCCCPPASSALSSHGAAKSVCEKNTTAS